MESSNLVTPDYLKRARNWDFHPDESAGLVGSLHARILNFKPGESPLTTIPRFLDDGSANPDYSELQRHFDRLQHGVELTARLADEHGLNPKPLRRFVRFLFGFDQFSADDKRAVLDLLDDLCRVVGGEVEPPAPVAANNPQPPRSPDKTQWSKPMSKKDAARLLGCPHKKKPEWINKCVEDGTLRIRTCTRTSFQFDLSLISENVRDQFRPT